MPRGHLFAVCFLSRGCRVEMLNGLAFSLVAGKTPGVRRMRSQLASVPLGAVRGTRGRWDTKTRNREEGEDLRGK